MMWRTRFTRRTTIAVLAIMAWTTQGLADNIVYTITDVGTFPGYSQNDTTQSYASGGAGFVGLYSDSFGHLFGVESNFSKTALEVDISGLTGKVIQSAVLSFDILNGSGGSQALTITSYTATGTIGHYFNAPDNLGTLATTVSSGSNSIDVTGIVPKWRGEGLGRLTVGADLRDARRRGLMRVGGGSRKWG